MFLGEFHHSLDNKNRVSVPAKFRQLGSNFYLTPGLDDCLFLFPQENFQKVVDELEKVHFTQSRLRKFMRIFMGKAKDVVCDRLGRITITDKLKEFAKIRKEVVFLGQGHRIEIWNSELWKAIEEESMPGFTDLAEDILRYPKKDNEQ